MLKIILNGALVGISSFGLLMLVTKYEPQYQVTSWALVSFLSALLTISNDLKDGE